MAWSQTAADPCDEQAICQAQRGAQLLAQGRVEEAAVALEKALLLDPNLPGAQLDYAQALAQCGNAPEAQDTQKLGDFLLSGMRAPRTVYALNVPIDPSHLQLVSSMEAGAVG